MLAYTLASSSATGRLYVAMVASSSLKRLDTQPAVGGQSSPGSWFFYCLCFHSLQIVAAFLTLDISGLILVNEHLPLLSNSSYWPFSFQIIGTFSVSWTLTHKPLRKKSFIYLFFYQLSLSLVGFARRIINVLNQIVFCFIVYFLFSKFLCPKRRYAIKPIIYYDIHK